MTIQSSGNERFAVYYTFAQEHALYQKASQWLGHCIYAENSANEEDGSLFAETVAKLRRVDNALRYGFHATLKPPFRLTASREQLEESFETFCSELSGFSCAPLRVTALGHFIALVPIRPCEKLDQLAIQCVEAFEPFRAVLTRDELEKRQQEKLNPRQRQLLARWGYPYVFDQFRFHMTLTDRLPDDMLDQAKSLLASEFSSVIPPSLEIDRIGLLHQPDTASRFSLIKAVKLGL
jgi:hypothetical protein